MEKTEAYEIKGRLYQTPLQDLKKVISENQLCKEDIADITRFQAIQIVDSWYEKEIQGQDDGTTAYLILNDALPRFSLIESQQEIKSEKTDTQYGNTVIKSEKTETQVGKVDMKIDKTEAKTGKEFVRWKDFKVSGQVIDSRNGLAFVSLVRQIENGVKKGYAEVDIIDGVIKAIVSGSQLRNYLEGRSELNLKSLRRILRAHFKEKTATELYQDLGNATQQKNEEPQEFLLRLMGLKQKIQFVSKESGNDMKYDNQLVDTMFRRTFYTGLQDDIIRREIQATVEDTGCEDEELLQNLSSIVSRERERSVKLGKNKVAVRTVSESVEATHEEKITHKPKEGLVVSEIKQLRAEVAALRNLVLPKTKDDVTTGNESPRNRNSRLVGCTACREAGTGKTCRHCWVCGSEEHFSRGCLKKRQFRQQENSIGSLPGGKKGPNSQMRSPDV